MAPTASKWLEQILHTQNGYTKYTDLKIWRLFNPNHPPFSLGKIRKESWKTTTLCDEYELLLQHLKDILFFCFALYITEILFKREFRMRSSEKNITAAGWNVDNSCPAFFMKNEQRIKSKHETLTSRISSICCNAMSLFWNKCKSLGE